MCDRRYDHAGGRGHRWALWLAQRPRSKIPFMTGVLMPLTPKSREPTGGKKESKEEEEAE